MNEVFTYIKDFGFPAVVAIFVLVRLEPAIRRLDQSITTLTVVSAKANGMGKQTIEEIVARVMAKRNGKRRRVTDVFDDEDGKTGKSV